MEIYTTDLIEIAKGYADQIRINSGDNHNWQIFEDECCNLQRELRNVVYKRLSVEFEKIIIKSKEPNFDLRKEIFKTINEI